MITVHHLEHSRSQRVLWLLEELGLAYEVKRYARDPKTMLAPPELAAVHPLGKSPVITDGDVVVAESGAIVEYLVDTHGGGRLKPLAGTPAHRQYVYWLHFAEGTAMPPLGRWRDAEAVGRVADALVAGASSGSEERRGAFVRLGAVLVARLRAAEHAQQAAALRQRLLAAAGDLAFRTDSWFPGE